MISTKDIPVSQESDFIVDCLRQLISSADTVQQLPTFINDSIAWQRVLKSCNEHNIAGFIAHLVQKNGWLDRLPLVIQQILLDIVQTSKFNCAQKKLHLRNICKIISDNDIPLIVLKGAALAHVIYEDLPYRMMADVDILIRPQDKLKVLDLLKQQGFIGISSPLKNRWHLEILQSHEDIYWEKSGRYAYINSNDIQVDIHIEPIYVIDKAKVLLKWNRVWDRAIPWKAMGSQVYLLSPEDQLLFTAVHAIDRYNPQLIQLLDLAFLIQRYPLATKTLTSTNDLGLSKNDTTCLLEFICTVRKTFAPKGTAIESSTTNNKYLLVQFINKNNRKDELKSFFFSIYSRIKSSRIKIKYLLGLFFPDPIYYRKFGIVSRYFIHWSGLIGSIGIFLFQLCRKGL